MSTITIPNPHVAKLEVDHYYHIGFNSGMDLAGMFGDVKLVIFGGANDRMKKIAQLFAQAFYPEIDVDSIAPIGETSRFHMFKVGNVITCSHQMGQPSFSILLHEITKMLSVAKAIDPVYIRLGTSGGIDVDAGTVVISNKGFNNLLGTSHQFVAAGKVIERPSEFSAAVYEPLYKCSTELGFKTAIGGTMCCDDFYEGQSRLDGAICEYTEEDKIEFLKRAHDAGVVNIEMESCYFGAFTKYLNIKAATMCVTLVRRLNGDQVVGNTHAWVDRPIAVVLKYAEGLLGLKRHDNFVPEEDHH
jgi:uridine phosphorylase